MGFAERYQRLSTVWFLAPLCGVVGGALLVLLAVKASVLISAAILGGLVVAVVVTLFPELGFLLTCAVVPLERMGRFTDDQSGATLSLMRFVGMLALGSFLLNAVIKKWRLRFGPAVLLYSAFCAFGLGTVAFSNDPLGGMHTGGQVIGNLMFLFLVVNIVRDWKLAKLGILIWLAASVLAGIYTIYGWHFGGDRTLAEPEVGKVEQRFVATMTDTAWGELTTAGRAQGTTSHPAVHGLNMVLTLPFLAYLLRISRSRTRRILIAAAAAIILYNILLTNTRAAILLCIVVILACAFRRLFMVTSGRMIGALLVGAIMLFIIPSDVFMRALDPAKYLESTQKGTLRLRMMFWEAAVEQFQENWLFGVGLGNQTAIPSKVRGVSPTRISAHNDYLNMLVEVGLIGWLLFFSTVVLLIRSSFKAAALFRKLPGHQEQYWFMVAAQITALAAPLYGIQADVFHFPLKGWWLAVSLSVAMLVVAKRELQEQAAISRKEGAI